MTLLRDLRLHYDRSGISARNFRCRHRPDCSRGCKSFIEAREAYVGSDYELGTLPRLLFLSLDPGKVKGSRDRTLEGVRSWEEQRGDVSTLPKNRHWYRTHEIAWIILQRFDNSLTLRETFRYFAHTNSAKCCMNKPGGKQADRHLFRNCREFIPGEIGALRPDILVTQGKMARIAIEAAIPPFRLISEAERGICDYRILGIDQRQILWIPTHHPRNFGGFNLQRRRCLKRWADFATRFIDSVAAPKTRLERTGA